MKYPLAGASKRSILPATGVRAGPHPIFCDPVSEPSISQRDLEIGPTVGVAVSGRLGDFSRSIPCYLYDTRLLSLVTVEHTTAEHAE